MGRLSLEADKHWIAAEDWDAATCGLVDGVEVALAMPEMVVVTPLEQRLTFQPMDSEFPT